MPVVGIPGIVKVDASNGSLIVELEDHPDNVHVDEDPLPMTIER